MATLVLTAVGSAVGGPIGGAIGALIGQAVDHTVFAPARREGPRLVELAVQTSSYGSAIPQLFGTMRVAGTVIWATDLRETQGRSGGGKGQPATTAYSYSASFAVLLSARAIRRVGRIWADGRLIRGAGGDLKVKAALRIHTGGEDQPVDPLIASAEGAAAPAYRGMAYLVWEDLPLAEFGNRLPSLTVEVVADEAPVATDLVARAVAPPVRGGAATVAGFAASGSVRGVLAVLAELEDGWWMPEGAGLRLAGGDGSVVAIADAGVVAAGLEGVVRGRTIAPLDRVPRTVEIGHYEAARDYQAGLQRAVRPGPGRATQRTEMPAVLTAPAAKTLAGRLLSRAEADRTRRTVTLGLAGMAIAPGAMVTIAGEDGRWRVLDATVTGMATRLTLAPVAPATLPATRASGGRVAAAADLAVGATVLHVAELPGLDDALLAAPRLVVLAGGTGAGWRQAALLWSADGGAGWTEAGATAAPATIGLVEAIAPVISAATWDMAGAILVRLARGDMVLHDADDRGLVDGANLAVIGGELVQFGRAEPLGGGRWRLTRLLRARRGSVAAAAGDRFALLDPAAVRAIELPLAAIGAEVRVLASGVGDPEPVEARVRLTGASVRPPAPVHLHHADGMLRWTRRSRAGWRWSDGVEVPLVEETEAYRVTVTEGDAVRDLHTDRPWLALPPAAGMTVAVRQRGTWAESAPATLRWNMGQGE